MKKQLIIKLLLFILIILALIGFALYFSRLSLPFGVAYIIYLIARPLTRIFRSANTYQRIAYFCTLLILIGLMSVPVIAAINNFNADFGLISSRIPDLQNFLHDKYFIFKVFIFENFNYKLSIDPVPVILRKFGSGSAMVFDQIPTLVSTILEWILLIPMFLYFFFFQSEQTYKKFISIIPNNIFEKTYVLFSQFNAKFCDYITAKFIEATLLGSLVTLGLLAIGFPYPFIFGLVAGITNILPYIGPIIGFVPAIIVLGITKDPNVTLWPMLFVYLIANIVDMVVVFPLLVSKVVNLNPIIVVVSVIVGGQLGGVVGMIVIIPFIAFFKLLFEEIYKDLSIHL